MVAGDVDESRQEGEERLARADGHLEEDVSLAADDGERRGKLVRAERRTRAAEVGAQEDVHHVELDLGDQRRS